MYPNPLTHTPETTRALLAGRERRSRAEQYRELAEALHPTAPSRQLAAQAAEHHYSAFHVRRRLHALEGVVAHAGVILGGKTPLTGESLQTLEQVIAEALLYIAEVDELQAAEASGLDGV